jgi:hypothetical protein
MTRRTTVIAFAALSTLLPACGNSAKSSARPAAPTMRHTSEVITAEELAATGESNVYMAVQRLRPQWLRARPRGQTRLSGSEAGVVVYIDATRYGTLNSLQSLAIGGIYEIRRYDASEATNRFGTGHVNGAIVIRMSKP